MTDRPCSDCRHSRELRHEFLSPAAPASLVCTHSSAIRLNGGPWFHTIARELCAGRRFQPKGRG